MPGLQPLCPATGARVADASTGGPSMDMKAPEGSSSRSARSGLAASSLAMLGILPQDVLAEVRAFKLAHHRNAQHLPVLLGQLRRDHVHAGRQGQERQGRPSSTSRATPTIRSTAARCARRARALLDMIQSPEPRSSTRRCASPAANEWKRISWDDALTRIAKHMKADRDANFIEKNDKGVTVNRWNTTGLLISSAVVQRIRLPHASRSRAAWGWSHSIPKHEYDTRRRCPVWARLSVAVR